MDYAIISHYLSKPALSFFEKGNRSGVSYPFRLCSKTTNEYLRSFDPKLESNHIRRKLFIWL